MPSHTQKKTDSGPLFTKWVDVLPQDMWSLEAARFGFRLFQSLWNLTAALPIMPVKFRAILSLQHPISRLRDFARFDDKTSCRLVNEAQDDGRNAGNLTKGVFNKNFIPRPRVIAGYTWVPHTAWLQWYVSYSQHRATTNNQHLWLVFRKPLCNWFLSKVKHSNWLTRRPLDHRRGHLLPVYKFQRAEGICFPSTNFKRAPYRQRLRAKPGFNLGYG